MAGCLVVCAAAQQTLAETVEEADMRGLLTFQRGMQAFDFILQVADSSFVLRHERAHLWRVDGALLVRLWRVGWCGCGVVFSHVIGEFVHL